MNVNRPQRQQRRRLCQHPQRKLRTYLPNCCGQPQQCHHPGPKIIYLYVYFITITEGEECQARLGGGWVGGLMAHNSGAHLRFICMASNLAESRQHLSTRRRRRRRRRRSSTIRMATRMSTRMSRRQRCHWGHGAWGMGMGHRPNGFGAHSVRAICISLRSRFVWLFNFGSQS